MIAVDENVCTTSTNSCMHAIFFRLTTSYVCILFTGSKFSKIVNLKFIKKMISGFPLK